MLCDRSILRMFPTVYIRSFQEGALPAPEPLDPRSCNARREAAKTLNRAEPRFSMSVFRPSDVLGALLERSDAGRIKPQSA